MTRNPSLPRRQLLRAITIAAVLFTAAACGTGQRAQAPTAGVATPRPGAVIMIIRHGEKPGTPDPSPGMDADNQPDTHSLTARGWTRAHDLVALFAPSTGSLRAGLVRPSAIYASGGSGGEGARPRETVTRLAAHLGLRVDTSYAKGDEAELAQHIATLTGPTLICWQHQEIPAIAAALGHVTPQPPSTWPSDRFDMVWTFTATDHGWAFAQVPQILLSGDDAHPIQ
jgi:hypothetical protein